MKSKTRLIFINQGLVIVFGLLSAIVISCHQISGETDGINSDSLNTHVANQIADLFEQDWIAPDTASIPEDETGSLIHYGRELVANTGAYFGPRGKVNHFANGMNCQNCHPDAGTKLYGNSFSAVNSIYPKLRARSGMVEHLEKRINDCMERSMNGKKLDSLSHEMRAMVAYINWVEKMLRKALAPKVPP